MTFKSSAAVVALLLASPAAAEEAAPSAASAPVEAVAAAPQPEPVATPPEAQPAAPVAAATTPSAPQLGAPASGKGQVVFFRKSAFQGMIIRCTVREDGALVGGLPNGSYFIRDLEPGLHTFTAATEAKDTLRLEVEAGEVYYNRCSIAMGIMAGRPNLAPSDKAAFDKDGAKLKLQPLPAADEN